MLPPVSLPKSEPRVRPSRATVTRLIALGRPEAKRIMLGTFFLIIGAGASLLYPQGIRVVLDGASPGAPTWIIDRTALLMALVAVVFGTSIALRYRLFSMAGERV